MAEIMQPNAMSIGFFIHWVLVIAAAFSLPDDPSGIPYLFIGAGGVTFLGFLFMIIFVHETKGKTQTEI